MVYLRFFLTVLAFVFSVNAIMNTFRKDWKHAAFSWNAAAAFLWALVSLSAVTALE